MNRWTDITAKALSILLYPLFVPTYGVALFCYAYAQRVVYMPLAWVLVAVIGTFVLTCLLPVTAIAIMMRRGQVSDFQITNAQERTMPYIYSILGFGFWCYLVIAILHAPASIGFVAVGATVAITMVAWINRRWKISAHLTGLGGMIGGMLSYYMGIGLMPSWGAMSQWFLLTVLLMYARVHLDAHTPAQVCAGWLLGLACTFIPYCIYLYVA